MKLSETKKDTHGRVKRIEGDAHFVSRVTAIGMIEGVPFQTVRNNKRMPVLVYLRETLIALNRSDAERIEVESE